jgi:hypothetical protein
MVLQKINSHHYYFHKWEEKSFDAAQDPELASIGSPSLVMF